MADLTREDVIKLARLARLEISDEEIEKYRKELSDVLKSFQQLSDADTTNIEPTTQVTGLKNVMRDDIVRDYGVSHDDLMRIVPQKQDGQIKVKRMIV